MCIIISLSINFHFLLILSLIHLFIKQQIFVKAKNECKSCLLLQVLKQMLIFFQPPWHYSDMKFYQNICW